MAGFFPLANVGRILPFNLTHSDKNVELFMRTYIDPSSEFILRTDIFAFGCVLYEMLTGKRAFNGEDVADVLGAVLKTEPDWSLLPAGTPPGIRKLLVRCLEKNANNRRADANDVRMDIDEALSERAIEPVVSNRGWNVRPAWIAAAVMTLAFVAIATVHIRETLPKHRRNERGFPSLADPGMMGSE